MSSSRRFQWKNLSVSDGKVYVVVSKYNATNIKEDGCLDLYTNKWIPYKFDLSDCFELNFNIQWMNDSDFLQIKTNYKEPFFHFDADVFNCQDKISHNLL
jgi:hypothetical protein